MGFTVVREGQRIARQLEGRRTLAEILTGEEYERAQAGDLVPFTEAGGLMSLDSPLTEGQTVVLRQLEPGDLAGFGRHDPASGEIAPLLPRTP